MLNNIFIEGENLDALKMMQKKLTNKIKMIYIDPPYNTRSKKTYNDNLTHEAWVKMMKERLVLAKPLLRDDGIIFISIDDHEQARLKLLCDDIFGEENVKCMVWNKESEGLSGNLKRTLRFRTIHEYIVVCYKNHNSVRFAKVTEPIKNHNGKLDTTNLAVNKYDEKKGHPNWMELISPTGVKWYKHWKFDNDQIKSYLAEDLIYWGKEGNNQPRLILPKDERRKVFPTSIIQKSSNTEGRKDCDSLMNINNLFTYPKPVKLLKYLIEISGSDKDSIILDFFAGSGTTGQAVMELNAEDGGNRKFILVQIPEKCDEKSEAYKDGYKTISEITEERLRRAFKKLTTK